MENLSIKAVSKIVGVSPFVLRAWERRYQLLVPKRSSNGRRTYTLSEVEKLRLIVALKNAGHSLAQISSLSIRELTRLLNNTSQGPDGVKNSHFRNQSPQSQLANLLTSIQQLNMDQLAAQLKILQLQLDTKSFLLEVIAPLFRNLGVEVAANRLEVFHEHATSALVKHILTGILFSIERSTNLNDQNPVIFSTPENDLHEFGVLIGSILALINGYRIFYLGPHMPAKSLARAAEMLNSPMVVLGCSAPSNITSVEDFRNYVRSLTSALPKSTLLWIGGARIEDLKGNFRGLRTSDSILHTLEEFDQKLRTKLTFQGAHSSYI